MPNETGNDRGNGHETSVESGTNWLIQGLALQSQGQLDEAETCFQRLLAHEPDNPYALYSMAVLMMRHNAPQQTLAFTTAAVERVQHVAILWLVHATAQQTAGDLLGAIASFEKSLVLDPNNVSARINFGTLLCRIDRSLEGAGQFRAALEVEPTNALALNNLADIYEKLNLIKPSIEVSERLMLLEPPYRNSPGIHLARKMIVCDWAGFYESVAAIERGVEQDLEVTPPLHLKRFSDRADLHWIADRQSAHQLYTMPCPTLWQGERYHHHRIRIAYISPDLRAHAVGHMMAGILAHHDKGRFEVYGISTGRNDVTPLRERIMAACDHFVDARTWSVAATAEYIRNAEIDILIDLAGHTSSHRLEAFAYRCAPVQVTYMGYPGGVGSRHVDYLIADRHVAPPEMHPYFDEKIVYLPHSYLPAAADLTPYAGQVERARYGLPEQGTVYCSFNHPQKYTPYMFGAWMQVLRAVEGSVLWLLTYHTECDDNLRLAAAAHGIDPKRIVFAKPIEVAEHLARIQLADLFLDTHPYNSHTTCGDALLAGTPVLTYFGRSFPSRVAGSLLRTCGLPELVCETLEQYVAQAIRIGRDPSQVAALKARIQTAHRTSPLFNPTTHARSLEAIYTTLWRQSQLRPHTDVLTGLGQAGLPSGPAGAGLGPAHGATLLGETGLGPQLTPMEHVAITVPTVDSAAGLAQRSVDPVESMETSANSPATALVD